MREVNTRQKGLQAKSGRTVVLYFLLLMLALAGMVSMKRCQSSRALPAPAVQTEEQEIFIETVAVD